VKEPRHDDERLSALLAGRLEGPERDELLAYLSTADEDREVVANTAAILREMEEEDAREQEAGVSVADPPPRRQLLPPPSVTESKRRFRTPRWAVLLVLVGLAASGMYALLRGGGGVVPAGDPVGYVAALQIPVGENSAGLFDELPGLTFRGGGEPGEPARPTPENAAQAGVLLVRLAIAVQAQDTTARALAAQVKNDFDPLGGGSLEQIRERAGEPAGSLDSLVQDATNRVEAQYDSSFVGLGAWTEAARIAAIRRSAAFFQSDDTRDMLGHAETLTSDDPGAKAALADVRTLLNAQGERNWSALETGLTTLRDQIVN
jgi:hypothetical protein